MPRLAPRGLSHSCCLSASCDVRRRRVVTARTEQASRAARSVPTASTHSSSPSSRQKGRNSSETSRSATRSALTASTPWCRTAAPQSLTLPSSLPAAWQPGSPGSSRCCGERLERRQQRCGPPPCLFAAQRLTRACRADEFCTEQTGSRPVSYLLPPSWFCCSQGHILDGYGTLMEPFCIPEYVSKALMSGVSSLPQPVQG